MNTTSSQPLVSVIVPVYNMEQYVAETVASILQSTYQNIEIILMDDGSTDQSLSIIQQLATTEPRIAAHTQPNGGVCRARNHAIHLSSGKYILPVDADDKISAVFIEKAVEVLENDDDVKVVNGRSQFFGDKVGDWNLPPYSLKLLTRKNILPSTCLYRREDWLKTEGYCAEIIAREDWELWIALLKDGGKVVKIPEVGIIYRIRNNSKRITDRKLKGHIVATLNRRYPDFFERQLGGPLRIQRTWSRLTNRIYRLFHPRYISINQDFAHLKWHIKAMPRYFAYNCGTVIHNRRNQLRRLTIGGTDVVVKRFARPNIVNSIVYGIFRRSKANRSYKYATEINELGIVSPTPIAYYQERTLLFLRYSYYISAASSCSHTFYDVINNKQLPHRKQYLEEVGRRTAQLHIAGYYPLDYSGGNILLDYVNGDIKYELVDLNRMQRGAIDMDMGCRGFERLNVEPEALDIMASAYATARGFDVEECKKRIRQYRWKKHQGK